MQRLKPFTDLLLVDALALFSLLAVIFVPSGALKIVPGLPLALFYPGYVLSLTIYPREGTLTRMERLVLSPVFSILAMVSISLVLNVSPWGITLLPVAVALAVFIYAATPVAWYRRAQLDKTQRYRPSLAFDLSFWKRYRRADRVLAGVLALVMIAAVGILAYVLVTPNEKERFTEFYLLGTEGRMTDYPAELAAGETATVRLVIVSYERRPTSYRVEMQIDGAARREIGPVTLGHEEEWQQEVLVTPTDTGNQKVEFLLYKDNAREVYRSLSLLIEAR
jgi:uncharacterized membrane protein